MTIHPNVSVPSELNIQQWAERFDQLGEMLQERLGVEPPSFTLKNSSAEHPLHRDRDHGIQ